MGRYRKIDPRIWNDAKFRGLSDNAQLLFLFVLTHPHMTPLGAMRATIEGLAAEKGWTPKAFREAFQEASAKGLLKADERACFVGAPNFLKYNQPESPNVVRSWIGCVDSIPECNAKDELLHGVSLHLEGLSKGFPVAFAEAFPEARRHPCPNQEQEQEQEQEPEQEQKKSLGDATATIAVSPDDVYDWFQQSDAITKPTSLTPERRKKLVARLRACDWPWRDAISKLPIPNTEKFTFQPTFDWLIQNDANARKVAEGQYDARNGTKPVSSGTRFDATKTKEFGNGF